MIHSKLETRSYFSKYFDPYGDSYEEEITETALKELFDAMADKPISEDEFNEYKIRKEIAEIEMEYFNDESYNMGIFRLNVFYVDIFDNLSNSNKIKNSSLNLVELKLKWHGGIVKLVIDDAISHCVVHKRFNFN